MDKILDKVMNTVEAIITFMLGCEVIIVAAQILWRYVFKSPLSWTDQICRFGLQWIVMLGIPLIFHRKTAVIFDIVVGKMTGMPRKILDFVTCLIITFFAVVFLICSIDYIAKSGSLEVAGFPWMKNYMLYSSQTVGSVLMLITMIKQSWESLLALLKK